MVLYEMVTSALSRREGGKGKIEVPPPLLSIPLNSVCWLFSTKKIPFSLSSLFC